MEKIRDCVVNIQLGEVGGLVRDALKAGMPAYQVFMEGMANGMNIVGHKYETGEFFLTELLGAAQVVDEGMEVLAPLLQGGNFEHVGKVVLGTVQGDLHDIGKNIVKMLLNSAGFDVYDLDVDAPSAKFVEKAKETNTDVVAISSLLTTTMGEMKIVIEDLKKSGLRDRMKVLVGGAPITDEYAREIGADAAGKDAAHGVRICKEWKGKR